MELLALSDAYEVAGNQLFHMEDILEQGALHALDASSDGSVSLVPARER